MHCGEKKTRKKKYIYTYNIYAIYKKSSICTLYMVCHKNIYKTMAEITWRVPLLCSVFHTFMAFTVWKGMHSYMLIPNSHHLNQIVSNQKYLKNPNKYFQILILMSPAASGGRGLEWIFCFLWLAPLWQARPTKSRSPWTKTKTTWTQISLYEVQLGWTHVHT